MTCITPIKAIILLASADHDCLEIPFFILFIQNIYINNNINILIIIIIIKVIDLSLGQQHGLCWTLKPKRCLWPAVRSNILVLGSNITHVAVDTSQYLYNI